MDLGLDLLRKTTAAPCLDERPLSGLSAVGIDQDVVFADAILNMIFFRLRDHVRIALADMPFYYVGATGFQYSSYFDGSVMPLLQYQTNSFQSLPNHSSLTCSELMKAFGT